MLFLNILKKSIANVFVFYFDAKHSDTLQAYSHVFFVTCVWVIVVRNRCGLLDHGTLKSVESQ